MVYTQTREPCYFITYETTKNKLNKLNNDAWKLDFHQNDLQSGPGMLHTYTQVFQTYNTFSIVLFQYIL